MTEFVAQLVANLRNREGGQALVEYALILALVSVVAIASLEAIGGGVTGILDQVAGALGGA